MLPAERGRDGESGRRFGLAAGLAFGIVATVFAWQGAARSSSLLSAAGAVLLAAAAIRPTLLEPIRTVWETCGRFLGAFQTRLALLLAFALFLAPLGILLRLLGRDVLSGRPNPACLTYFEDRRKRTFPPRSFELRF